MTGSDKYILYVHPKEYDTVLAVNERHNNSFMKKNLVDGAEYHNWIKAGDFSGEIDDEIDILYSGGFVGLSLDLIHSCVAPLECNIYRPENSDGKCLVATNKSFSRGNRENKIKEKYLSEPCGKIYLPLQFLISHKNLNIKTYKHTSGN